MKLKLILVSCLALVLALWGCGTTGASSSTANTSVASTIGSHKVVLTWAASTSSVTGYNVYRASGANSYVLLNVQPLTALSYTDSSVQSGQTYYYAVTAVDANGLQSMLSNQVTAVIPSP